MLQFFRLNDPYRLLLILLLVVLIRIPFFLSDQFLTTVELRYMLVGEKLASGAELYRGVLENIAPLSAAVYGIIDAIAGRSQNAYYILSAFLLAFQCYLVNRLFLENKAYNENTYVPAIIYALFSSIFFDFLTLTPAMLSITFLLLALHNIFSHVEFRAKDDTKILNIGLYLGIAALFYLPAIIFGLAAFLIFVVFTGTVARRYLMMLFGFLLPLVLTAIYFLITNRFDVFFYSFINPIVDLQRDTYLTLLEVGVIFAIPIVLLLVAVFRLGQGARMNNFQQRLAQVMFVWLVFCVLYIVLADTLSPNVMVIFALPVTYYLSHYFLLMRRRIFAELIFLLFVFGTIGFNYVSAFNLFKVRDLIQVENYLVAPKPAFKDKKVLVLGNDVSYYYGAKATTPFLNWKISGELFLNPDYYDNLTYIYEGIIADPPDVVIDSEGVYKSILMRIPLLDKMYQAKNGIYYLRSN